MYSEIKALPFFFRELEGSKKVILSNLAGAFTFLDDRADINNIIYNKFDKIPDDKIEELLSKNFLSEENEFDTRINLIASKYTSILKNNITSPSLFMIVPTLRCDHDCNYCQVSRASINKTGYDLNQNNIENIIDLISSSPNYNIKIEFQGGEPLLAFEFIKTFIEKSLIALKDKNLSFVICSALGPLTADILDWCKKYNIYFSTSIDGHKALHEINRPSKYFKSHTNTVNNIKTIQNTLGKDKVDALTTISKESLAFPKEIIYEYYNLGFRNIFLRPLSPFGFAYHKESHIGYTAEQYFEFYKTALDQILEINKEDNFIEEFTLIHLKKIFRLSDNSYTDLQSPSGHALGAIIINYDGNIFGSDEARMLWETTKSNELILGKITNNGINFQTGKTINLLSDTFISCTPGCEDCTYQPYCGSDPLYHLSTQGDHIGNKSLSFFCQLERMIYDHIFTIISHNTNSMDIFKRWLNH